MATGENVCRQAALWLFMSVVKDALSDAGACRCPGASILAGLPSAVPPEACCLNFSGSAFGRMPWSVFTNHTKVEILDLSHCNISHIEIETAGTGAPAPLREVYLNHNRLTTLPGDFLASQHGLTLLHLSTNLLQELPEGFLRGSDDIEELDLQGNRLRSLPGTVLHKPGLRRLELDSNPWHCSCPLVESLVGGGPANRSSGLRDLVGNLTCASPAHLAGRAVWSVRPGNACRPPSLTALFILLPLLLLSALVLCWCCGRERRRKKKKDMPSFDSERKKTQKQKQKQKKQHCGAGPNGQKHRSGDGDLGGDPQVGPEGILKNQLPLRPPSVLLGSTRDLYEEVEVKLGSVESSSRHSGSTEGRPGSRGPAPGPAAELDVVSVSEVLKDSADREKAYLTQSTEYYSLVPGMDLDDSDHAERESIDLS